MNSRLTIYGREHIYTHKLYKGKRSGVVEKRCHKVVESEKRKNLERIIR